MGILPQAVVDVLSCVYISNLNTRSNVGINKWNEIKENNIIQCKIIANSSISTIKPSSPHKYDQKIVWNWA